MKAIRQAGKWSAFIALGFMIVQRVFHIEVPEFWLGLEPYVLGICITLGILTDTSKVPAPLSWSSILEKLKSPLAITSIVALVAYVMYEFMPAARAEELLQVVDYIFVVFFGFNVWQSPNARNSFR